MTEPNSNDAIYPIKPSDVAHTRVNPEQYQALYQESVETPDEFWAQQAAELDWRVPPTRIKNTSFDPDDVYIRWFEDGEINVCVNCVDRYLATQADKTAIIWESDQGDSALRISYRQLHEEVCRLANALTQLGVRAGDRVILYMPMIPQAAYAMLACARLGAVHSVVFGGFSAQALADRIADCHAKLIITADVGNRGGKQIPLKASVDEALSFPGTDCVEHVVSVRSTQSIAWYEPRDLSYQAITQAASCHHEPEFFPAEHPLFILYTSGSTGKPKGLQHSSGGYLTYVSSTFRYVFDFREDDVYWCAADVGWITGHGYIVYGPLSNGATTLMFEGVPTSPTVGRFGEIIDKHQVTIFYTAPTAIRTLIAKSDEALESSTRQSLRLLGSVGEPINPDVWRWYHDRFGHARCAIVDTWWQTETGGFLITPLPGATPLKPGSATRPFFGVQPALVDDKSHRIDGEGAGHLVMLDSWPGQARTIWGNHQRFVETYFSTHKGMYFSGDGARRDEDGYYWITGRVDDVLNVSGHRLGTAEIESAVVAHPKVAEAAVVPCPHEVKGESIYVFIEPIAGVVPDTDLTKEIKAAVRKEVGPVASPDYVQWAADGLPKTRSGKIMRRILRKIAERQFDSLGDTSTLADPSVVRRLIEGRDLVE